MRVWRALDQKWYQSGRRYRDLGRLYGKPNPIFIRWLNHPSYDRYWQKMIPYREQFARIDIPVLTITGYYAGSEPGALYYFTQHHRYNPHADHTLLIGPYDDSVMRAGRRRCCRAMRSMRRLSSIFASCAISGSTMSSRAAQRRRCCKDRVNYEVMGANEWRHAASIEAMATETSEILPGCQRRGRAAPAHAAQAAARRRSCARPSTSPTAGTSPGWRRRISPAGIWRRTMP